MSVNHFVCLLLTITVVASACSRRAALGSGTVARPVETAPTPPPPPPLDTTPLAPARDLSEEELFARKSLAELNAERPLGEVFFPLDEAVLTPEGRDTLQRNAEWLRRWASTRATIEGHCDERGTSEYNLALGDRRASAVKNYLMSLGIDGGRLLVVSKGKEAPRCEVSSESCWQQNRRAESILTAK